MVCPKSPVCDLNKYNYKSIHLKNTKKEKKTGNIKKICLPELHIGPVISFANIQVIFQVFKILPNISGVIDSTSSPIQCHKSMIFRILSRYSFQGGIPLYIFYIAGYSTVIHFINIS